MDSIDARLETALARREPALGDDRFTDTVMMALPRRRLAPASVRRRGLGIAVAIGGSLTLLFGAAPEGVMAALIAALLCVPAAWVFYSR